MKRMIACEKCAERPGIHYEGEWFKRIQGNAKKDMLCDYCCPPTPIKKGDKCAGESMGVNGRGLPYYAWESEYIKFEKEA
jgi:hypothetical protein